ncbi:MAG: hypothetical protein LBR60_06625 [Fibrobacter sp.]|jgi:tRNA G46 methylase TrmB|nr:hypothetical protein [Fibrobacter sp.]
MNFSKKVTSNQEDIHSDLEKLVTRYAACDYRRPVAEHTQRAFESAMEFANRFPKPLILDSGCGTGDSSLSLARKFPEHPVLGLDKSEIRLLKKNEVPGNVLLLRAELLDFWRLLVQNKIPVHFHALYYPNPWPKQSHLGRRFHAHPVFPALLRVSRRLELRTNWEIYAREFAAAAETAARLFSLPSDVSLSRYMPEAPETAFEKKYLESGHFLWRVIFLSLK